MKKRVSLTVIIVLLFFIPDLKPDDVQAQDLQNFAITPRYIKSDFQEWPRLIKSHKKHKHRRKIEKRLARCRRHLQYQSYYQNGYQINPNQNQYLLTQYYIPPNCNTYCDPCSTSSCRRRCPTIYYPSLTPMWLTQKPIRTTEKPPSKTTPSRTTSKRPTRTTHRTPTTRTTPGSKGTSKTTAIWNNNHTPAKIIIKNPCACDPNGSKFLTCNQSTGACFCKSHYVGFDCSICEDGYWKKNKACVECKCNKYGTTPNTVCDKETGNCQCKPGVTGQHCTNCLPDHYGSIQTTCKKCDPCNKKGHICDPTNGKCVCPPLTTGQDCENCAKNSWGYEPGIGCKECNCSLTGSFSQQCDQTKGICSCNIGFEGEKCNRCSFGYFGYPDCKKCVCDPTGTDEDHCQHGLCKCDNTGICKCKENVRGKHCDRCKENHYGLSKENVKGCTECFCFGRSNRCQDAEYHWNKSTRLERNLEEDNQVNEDELSLPKSFLGDLTSSYGGYLVAEVAGGYFDVFLEGNNVKLTATYNQNELQLIESNRWKVSSRNLDFPDSCIDKLTRTCFMVILQNVTSIIIRANNRIKEILLDKATSEISTHPMTHSVEKCKCPPQFTGLSCEDPNKGYYRYFSEDSNLSWIDRIIGIAKKCECREYSTDCDPETGHCKNCTHHTTGEHCEKCDDGYYLDKEGECKACLCPSAEQNNAKTCTTVIGGDFTCQCKKGYTGQYCDKCDAKYYSASNSSLCVPCDCNEFGVFSGDTEGCDEKGICRCKEGFTGDKCNQCVKEREYIENGVCKSCDKCTMLLFEEIDCMKDDIENIYEMFRNGVGPPWKKLTENLKKYNMSSEKYKSKQKEYDDLLKGNQIIRLESKVGELEQKVTNNNHLLEDNINNADKLTDNSTRLLKETDDLSKKLVGIIEKLENVKDVNLNEALSKAHRTLKDIQKSSLLITNFNNTSIFKYCSSINRKVDTIYGHPPTTPSNIINEIKRKLTNLFDLTNTIENIVALADAKNTKNSQRLESVKEKIEILKSKNKHFNTSFGSILDKINKTEDVLENLYMVYQDLVNISNFIEYDELDNRGKKQMEDIPEVQTLYDKAVDHVQEMERKVEEYNGMFNFTKDEWKKINAGGAYESIIRDIKESQKILNHAKETREKSKKLIMPDDADNLDTKSNLAQTFSDRLKQRIHNLKNLSKNLNEMKGRIDQLKYSIVENGKSNNEVSQNLQKTNENITSQAVKVHKLKKSIRSASEVSDRMRDIYKKTDDMIFDKQFNFDKKYQKYQEQINPKEIKHLNSDLRSARNMLESLQTMPPTYNNVSCNGSETSLRNLENKTKRLQNLINLAKQQIEGVDVPMNLTNCSMTYKLPKKQYFQSLAITFNCKDCLLFNWTKTTEKYFIVRVKEGKVTASVEGKNIDVGESGSGENTLRIQKTGSILKLQLGVKETSIPLYGMQSINIDDSLKVGNTEKSKNEIDNAYVYKIVLNGENFGLWNFADTNGKCMGQKRTVSVDDNINSLYNGKGYFIYGQNNDLRPNQFSIRFEFSTFDENSNIYIGAHIDTCSFINLYLENGIVHTFIQFNNTENMILTSSLKVNDGKSYPVEISSSKKDKSIFYNLKVNNTIQNTNSINANNVFKIKYAEHYLGGVPPTFNRSCIPIRRQSLLGFLELKSQLSNASISYGIVKTKSLTLTFSHVWIKQNGSLHLKYPQEVLENISFILRPTVSSGKIIQFNNNQGIDLDNLDIIINGSRYNDPKINLNDYNSIEIEFGKTNKLKINGVPQNLTNVATITIKDLQLGHENGEFEGGIRDIIINNRIIQFNTSTVISFENVEIGREPPLLESHINMKSLAMTNLTNSMQNTDRCTEFDSNDVEQEAIKFGDKRNSYTYIATKFWRSNFTLLFDFRTFYPNGVLFISMNKRRNYILLQLKDGQLQLNIEGRKKKVKTLPISSGKKMNDGNWHNIRLTRKLKKLTVIVDKQSKPNRINMRIKPKDELYFGGVSPNSEYAITPDLTNQLIPFRGCMRSLEINNERQFLINNKNVQHSNITLCFSKVEDGAYFGGDAYAIYKDGFQISEMLELSFEFRTSEQNGILLSVSNHGDYPALSVELQNGAIVMAINLGNGIVSNVTNNLNSDIALCNNKWHNVTAMYSSSELTVNVDGIRKSWVQSDINSTMDDIEAPLYIGGLPDNASTGTLKTLTNFKGCIRKLKIENQLIDWLDMNDLNNVLLNSCPITEIS